MIADLILTPRSDETLERLVGMIGRTNMMVLDDAISVVRKLQQYRLTHVRLTQLRTRILSAEREVGALL
jgi:hypothetical protein